MFWYLLPMPPLSEEFADKPKEANSPPRFAFLLLDVRQVHGTVCGKNISFQKQHIFFEGR